MLLFAAGRYDWAQSLEEVLIEVLVPPNTSAEDVYIKFDATNLAVALNSQLILSGQLSGITDPSVNSWHLGELLWMLKTGSAHYNIT